LILKITLYDILANSVFFFNLLSITHITVDIIFII